MLYAEFLRVRRALRTYAIVILAIAGLITASLLSAHVYVNDHELRAASSVPPLSIALTAALFGSLLFGTLIAGSLNRERETIPLSWTRPVSRERLGLAVMWVDFCGILAAALATIVAGCIPLYATGILSKIRPDAHTFAGVALMLGMTVMWYGLVQAATSWSRIGAGLAIGLSWVLFPALTGLGHLTLFGPIFADVLAAANYLNPLAYASSYVNTANVIRVTSYLPFDESVRICATWSIGLAACAVAIYAWKRSEA